LKCIKNKFYDFYSLKNRFNKVEVSKIETVILNKENTLKESKWISKRLKFEIEETLNQKKQIILFLNQKGLYAYARCKNCTKIFECNFCTNFYTIYENFICICHRCEKKIILPDKCIYCEKSSYSFENCFVGTSNIKINIQNLFSNSKITIADSKSISNKKEWSNVLEKMKNNEIDILIGTKMITRGYHFKNVQLVGIICGDIHLGIPHVSSVEKTIQEIIQVSGRCGRENFGKVILQTLLDHDFYNYLSEEKYLEFCEVELEFRKKNNFFPFKKTAIYLISGFNEENVKNCSNEFYKVLKNNLNEKIIFYQPIKCYFYKVKNKYFYYIYGKSNSYESLKQNLKFINFFENKFNTNIKYIPNYF